MTTAQNDQANGTPHIYSAIRAVMDKVRGVPKAGEMRLGQGVNAKVSYTFQKYDDMAAALGAAFRDEGIMIQASVVELTVTEWDKRKDGGEQRNARVVIRKLFKFTSLHDGSMLEIEAAGEGADNSDKATNKAETGAIKNALKQAFLLSTGEDDPDATRPDDTGRPVERVLNDRWSEARRVVAEVASQPPREYPAKARELAATALSKIGDCRTAGDLEVLYDWAAKWHVLPVTIDGAPLAARFLAAQATLPAGPPTPREPALAGDRDE